jgi:hypothetical protein
MTGQASRAEIIPILYGRMVAAAKNGFSSDGRLSVDAVEKNLSDGLNQWMFQNQVCGIGYSL